MSLANTRESKKINDAIDSNRVDVAARQSNTRLNMTATERAVLLFRIRNGVKLLLIVITFTIIAIRLSLDLENSKNMS
jgi:hypothetical protein